MKKVAILLFTIIVTNLMAQNKNFLNELYNSYENYKEETITHKRFKHSDIVPLIKKLKENKLFTVDSIGHSVENRDIYLVKAGEGKTKILLWSQMHGDESTATMALFDIFNFFLTEGKFDEIKEKILEETTLYFIPMLNPDGAERFQRRNIFDIDINRDALRTSTPEGELLKKIHKSVNADFAFNLHDQSTLYTAGRSPKSAAISFLAPTTNYEKTVDEKREESMKLIGFMHNALSQFIPGHIAKYNDDFEPRAFGDNSQVWGSSTILIESGGWKDDPEKQFLRKMNFISIISAFKSIAEDTYQNISTAVYDTIPFNDNYLKDLLLRNLLIETNGYKYKIDIGINIDEINTDSARSYYLKGDIDDIGDLSIFYGYEEIDLEGFEVVPGKIYPEEFTSIEEIEDLDFEDLYEEGYLFVKLKSEALKESYVNLPVNILLNKNLTPEEEEKFTEIELGRNANLVIVKEDEPAYVVINGFLYDVENEIGNITNTIVR